MINIDIHAHFARNHFQEVPISLDIYERIQICCFEKTKIIIPFLFLFFYENNRMFANIAIEVFRFHPIYNDTYEIFTNVNDHFVVCIARNASDNKPISIDTRKNI